MTVRILTGDCRQVLETLEDESVHCIVTSPPYWGLRDYGVAGQLGLEPDFHEYVANLVEIFRKARRVLRKDGTLWLNLGDSYCPENRGENAKPKAFDGYAKQLQGVHFHADIPTRKDVILGMKASGIKRKDLVGIPWRVAFALQAEGWYLRQDIIWAKPNPMPESVTDRCTKAHEYIFLLSRSERYYYDQEAIAEASLYPGDNRALRDDIRKKVEPMCMDNGSRARTGNPTGDKRNKRSVWEVATHPFPEAHFATFPPALVIPCIKAGCPAAGTVLDPFGGAGTTGLVADRLGRNAILIELNPQYAKMAENRIHNDAPLFATVEA